MKRYTACVPFFGFKHKFFETQLQLCGDLATCWELELHWRKRGDHPGVFFSVAVPRIFFFEANIYDSRHDQ